MYQLHSRLKADTFTVCHLTLRLLDDNRFPWFILVPCREDMTEIHQLSEKDQQLIRESSQVSAALNVICSPDKINIAALGNLVPQLHWHVVARSRDDACWPGPVWGCGEAQHYTDQAATRLKERMKQLVKPEGTQP
ncbi:HIT domain-containing protein [Candidatus Vondammii sp. HM_W22]|uniref:HIT domain-containing protein n=1 Tax=Candidatus Vondammii sp. HM_W22 TaxID=2687299 RepID=UPI001F139428|nr:HIT family protein [Candidatus Vondammii sp. HM_W22]